MIPLRSLFIGLAPLPLTLLTSAEPSAGEKLFALQVSEILSEKCIACHSPEPQHKLKGGLELSSRETLLAGGDSGEVIVPGDAAKSLLYLATTWADPDFQMPPKEADRLDEEQQGQLRDWIDAGAPWADKDRIEVIRDEFGSGRRWPTSGALSKDWANRRYEDENLWAYQPITKPRLPADLDGHPIDHLIGAKLNALKLAPAPAAEPHELVRRLHLNFTGLPPSPEQVTTFIKAAETHLPGALRDRVSELLASPHYGEQMARHWLDVVRYADSSGFANDWERPNAWRYRDYVVRAFNEDKPYDQFVREQIAGDEIDPHDPEMLVAVGFLRMGAWEQTAMTVPKVSRQQWLDDVTDSVGQTFLAHALQCARCHDHKFDPIPTRDFYAVQAVFATTQFADRDAAFLPVENLDGMKQDRARFAKQKRSASQAMADINSRRVTVDEEAWFRERGLPYKSRQQAIRAGELDANLPPLGKLSNPDDLGSEIAYRKWLMRFSWEADRYEPLAYSVYNGNSLLPKNVSKRTPMPANPMAKGKLETTHVLGGGDPFSPTEPVEPGVVSAIPGWEKYKIPRTPGGRRKGLAQWITAPDNTLTARVIVNRVWQWHFGRGIAGNPNSFGATGSKPTHPELLDYLAAYLVEHDWSIKALHLHIATSETSARSTQHPAPAELEKADPLGESYAAFRPRRLAAEEFRDAMLAASGELNRKLGGIPVRPDINAEAALQPRMTMGTFAPAYQANPEPEQRNRRTLYALKLRGLRDPFMEVFNQPGPDASCEIRESSTVTPQVFSLLNSQETYDRALALAANALDAASPEATIREIYLRLFSRAPDAAELGACLKHWNAMKRHHADDPDPRPAPPTRIVRSAQEEKTGETFRFTEKLHAYESYVPDLQPHEVDAATRALAEVCLVLLNSNEFAYLY